MIGLAFKRKIRAPGSVCLTAEQQRLRLPEILQSSGRHDGRPRPHALQLGHQCVTYLASKVQYRTLVAGHIEWDEEEKKWILTIKDMKTGEEFKDEAPIIVNASGILSQPKMPDLPGMKEFEGRILHTARYDTSIDVKGKRVALVGAGSTSIQVLPQIQTKAAKVDCYIRGTTWVIPMFAHDVRRPEGCGAVIDLDVLGSRQVLQHGSFGRLHRRRCCPCQSLLH
jgi:cation diffusion facilitator CzcD-associated flavoprotein CzcO